MQLSTILLAALSATVASSRGFFASDDQQTLEETYKVPGKNPLEFCADPADYLVTVKSVDLDPNPPVPGQPLRVLANGSFDKQIEEGAYVLLTVKYNHYITLINTNASLCDNLPKIDIDCPVKKGDLSVDKSVDIPKVVPPGQYDVLATVMTKDDDEVVCMKGTVRFGR